MPIFDEYYPCNNWRPGKAHKPSVFDGLPPTAVPESPKSKRKNYSVLILTEKDFKFLESLKISTKGILLDASEKRRSSRIKPAW